MPGLDHFRAERRLRVNLAAQISGPESREILPCLLLDMGMGGARVRCAEVLSAEDQLQLVLTAPTLWEPLVLAARIAWVREEPEGRCSMGLQFQPSSGMQLLVLAELLRDHDRH